MFPPAWRTPGVRPIIDEAHAHGILGDAITMTSALLIVLHDRTKRAPASEHDALGMMSLGCVMENMWLAATALAIGFHVQSALASVEADVRRVLELPETMAIGFGVRLGYPKAHAGDYVRVRRDLADFTHRNRYRTKG